MMSMNTASNSRAFRLGGFTMIEMMIVVVMMSVLALIALPQYNQFVRDSRRSEGINALNQVATMLEQFHTENNTYTADLTALGFGAATWNNTDNANYRIRVVGASAGCPVTTCFRLRVQPRNGSEQWGDDFWYELWSDGRRTRRTCPSNSCSGGYVNGWHE